MNSVLNRQDIAPKYMKWLALAVAFGVTLVLWTITANAACLSCMQVKTQIQANLQGTQIGNVRKTPLQGMYEVQMGKTIAYTDSKGKLFIVGHMYDPMHNRDLTAERLADMNRIQWKDLPLKDAIVSGSKDGVKLAIFTDPECPYCRHLETMLKTEKSLKSLRIYTFLFPLESIHPRARRDAESIWCAKDQHQALLSVMLDGKNLPSGTCDASAISRNIALAQKLGINGTPGLISGAGRIMAGAPQSKDALLTWVSKK